MKPQYVSYFCVVLLACGTKSTSPTAVQGASGGNVAAATTTTQQDSAGGNDVGGAPGTAAQQNNAGGSDVGGAANNTTAAGGTSGAPGTGFTLAPGCAPVGTYACNPVTSEGCNKAIGETCDDDGNGGFMCYPPPNTVLLGGACNIVDGPSCAAGMVCSGASDTIANGKCAKYCCSNADCSGSAVCVSLDAQYGTLGYCQ